MSSTNKTTNYELSQFIGSDKPAWLNDYNQDMSKIDTGIHTAQSTATGADGKADANASNIGDMSYLATSAKNTLVAAVNEVNATAVAADNTGSAAATLANQAKAKADANEANINKFNLTSISTLSPTVSKGSYDSTGSEVKFATDTTSSIFKIYGRVNINSLQGQSGQLTVKLGDTSLRPTEAYNVNCGAIMYRHYTNGQSTVSPLRLNVATDGQITVTRSTASDYVDSLDGSVDSITIMIPPCLYFNKNFGDN